MQFIRFGATKFALLVCGLLALSSSARAADVAMQDISITALAHNHMFTGSNYITRDGVGGFGGSYSAPNFSTTFVNGDTLIQHITAPAGKMFSVTRDLAYTSQSISFNFFWQSAGDVISAFDGSISFDNLVGDEPTETFSQFGVGDAGEVAKMQYTGTITSSISFTGMTISIPVQSSPTATVRNYTIGSTSSVPFQFVGTSSNDVDLPMASIVDVPEPAMMSLLMLPIVTIFRRRR